MGWTIGCRSKRKNRSETPAANAYKIPSTKSKRSCKIGKRFQNKDADTLLPGPAKYDITDAYRSVKGSTPRYSIKSKRKDRGAPLGHETPGPGQYSPAIDVKYKKQPKYSFSSRSADNRNSETPGPAAYQLPSTMKRSNITMKGRWKDKSNSTGPGPNHYNPDRGARPQSARSYTISSRTFAPDKLAGTPGPALYNTSRSMGYQPTQK